MSHTEDGLVEGATALIGRDPRRMTVEELNALGHHKRPLLRAIRENCIECCAGAEVEVRRCRAVTCPMWPYRMATNPFFAGKPLDEERRAAAAATLGAARHRAASDVETVRAKTGSGDV